MIIQVVHTLYLVLLAALAWVPWLTILVNHLSCIKYIEHSAEIEAHAYTLTEIEARAAA